MRTATRLIIMGSAAAVLLLGACTDPGPTPPVQHEGSLPAGVTTIMAKPQYAHSGWGAFEIDAETRAVGAELRQDEMFIPGSTAKIFSISGAWEAVGPDSRITTPVYVQGRRSGSRLDGDLILVGAGDVTFGGRTTPEGKVEFTDVDHVDANFAPGAQLTPQNPLAGILSLAEQVRSSGITRITGDVVVDDRLFSSTWDPDPTPVMINDNMIDVTVRPGSAPGRPAALAVRPLAASYTVQNTVRTAAAGEPTQLQISGSAPGTISIAGTIAADSEPQLRVAPITDPAAFGRTVFIEALKAKGIAVGARSTGANPVALLPRTMKYPEGDRVAAFESPVYAEQARLIMKVSLNLGANLAICLMAVQAGSDDCEDGFGELRSYLSTSGVDLAGVALSDGRGGDPNDRATPLAVTQMLRYWIERPDFDRWRNTLPVLGVDGTLAETATKSAAVGKVFAKTGTAVAGDPLNGSYQVQAKALAGYFQARDGSWRVFDLVANNAGAGPDLTILFQAGEDVGEAAAALWEEANR
jgi:serine-type D-Ala-D-Ala carboxypeptidase/endopeptidase (penicillin-binding protein 4)